MDDTSHFGRSLRDNPSGFVVFQLEKVPEGTVLQEYVWSSYIAEYGSTG